MAETAARVWTISVSVAGAALEPVQRALDPVADAISVFQEEDGRDRWRLTAYAGDEPDTGALGAAIALAAEAYGFEPPPIAIACLPEIDWLAENRRAFAPVRAGRFVICPVQGDDAGSAAAADRPRAGDVVVRLNAGPAFGSGTHGSTRGCLIALDRLARRGRPRRVLDLGTGSGILAIVAAKLWRSPVVATDIDPAASATAAQNVRSNRVAPWVRTATGPGFRALPNAAKRFDLIAANILARPLAELAPEFPRHLAPCGRVLLSGLTAGQEWQVLPRFRAAGLRLADTVQIGAWLTLVLEGGWR